MSLRTQPLPIIFAMSTLWMAVSFGSILATSRFTDPIAYVGDLAVGSYCVWDLWRTRRRLHVLRENLTAATV